MSRARNRRLPVLRALVLFGLGGVWAVACGGPQPLGAAGSVCFRADDCQAGLACVAETLGAAKHVCSADLSGIVSMVDGAPLEGGDMPEATGGAPATPQAGSPATAGTEPGAAGKPAAGGAPGSAGAAMMAGAPAGGSASAGAPAGGSAAGGAAAGGAPVGGAGAAAGGTSAGGAGNGGATAGTGG